MPSTLLGHRGTVLLVDAQPENLAVLSAILEPDYRVRTATHGEQALAIAHSDRPPDLILLEVNMPDLDGREVCRRLKANHHTRRIPIIFVTTLGDTTDETIGLELGAVDDITKPVSPPIVKARVKTHLALYDQERHLDRLVQQRTQQLQETRLAVIQTLGRAVEYKDEHTGSHVVRMSHYARLIALKLGLSALETDLIFNAAPMHDVGKIGIPDAILQKPGKLDLWEWEIMRQHPRMGAEILSSHNDASDLLELARVIALTHHEKWNGTGYPDGLKGDQIPLAGRIVAVSDVFDALTSVRPYKAAWSFDRAFAFIEQNAGADFDPRVVAAFVKSRETILRIQDQYSNQGQCSNQDQYSNSDLAHEPTPILRHAG